MGPGMIAAFADEMEKIAFGPKQADKVLSLAKRISLPRASYKALHPDMHGLGMAGVPGKREAAKDLAAHGKITSQLPKELKDEAESRLKELTDPLKRLSNRNGPTLIKGKDPLNKQLSPKNLKTNLGIDTPAVPANQQKMRHAILKGHELDETSAKGSMAARGFGHRSPDVILREHNRVTTLPKGFEAVKDNMKAIRGHAEGKHIMEPYGLKYGDSPRLSRHARKRIVESMNQKLETSLNSAMKSMKEG